MLTRVANVDQAKAWDGDEGDDWTEHEETYNAAARRYDPVLFAAANISPGEQVLDIGCGCGATTRAAGRLAVGGTALGVDLSSRMLERARSRAQDEGIGNVRFEQADVQVHPFEEGATDVAISRFGAMFFGDRQAAYANIGRALKTGGRLAILTWQELSANEWLCAIRGALAAGRELPTPPVGSPGPFGLADPDGVRAMLAAAGFADVDLADVHQPMQLGATADEAYEFMSRSGIARGMLQDLDDDAAAQALAALRQTMVDHETDDGVLFDSASWLITATRP